jgi:Ion channel
MSVSVVASPGFEPINWPVTDAVMPMNGAGSRRLVCTIVIHALVMTAVVRASQATAVKVATRPNLLLIAVMVATVSVLMAAHTCEVIVWSFAYGLVDAVPAGANLLYFAFVNYTTLGYGDVVPVDPARLARKEIVDRP